MQKDEWKPLAALLVAYYPTSFKIEGDGDPDSPATKRGQAMLTAWYNGLADLPAKRVHAAIMHMVRTKSAFPSIADIRKHAEAGELTAATAWAEVIKEVGRVGRGGVPSWSDPRVGGAVDAVGGWQYICDLPVKDHPTTRAQFRQAFEAETELEGRRRTFQAMGVPTSPALPSAATLKQVLADKPVRRVGGQLDPEAVRGAAFEMWNVVDHVLGCGCIVNRPEELVAAHLALGKALKVVS
jgi:hypothetical protein